MSAALAEGLGERAELASQRCFRALLEATSRPGRIVELGPELPAPPAPLAPASYALLLSLVDLETPLWLDPAARRPEVEAALRFHCGCPLTTEPAAASFAVATGTAPPLAAFAQGTAEYPDRSTTLLLQVADLGSGERLSLRGPGIPGEAGLRVAGAWPGLWGEVRANHRQYLQGVDLVLVAGSRIAALPRSTQVEAG